VYRVVLGISWIGVLNVIGLFIIIGIGVDDVFVFYDTFAQTAHITDLRQRMRMVYARAMKATFITSFTTAAAFVANMMSPIPALRVFGIFMFMIVVMNFLMVITIWPAVLVIFETRINGKMDCFGLGTRIAAVRSRIVAAFGFKTSQTGIEGHDNIKYAKLDEESDDPPEAGVLPAPTAEIPLDGIGQQQPTRAVVERPIEQFFGDKLSPLIRKLRWIIVIFLFGVFIGSIVLSLRLQPSKRPPSFFPEDHNVQRFLDWQQSGTLSGSSLPSGATKLLGCDGILGSDKIIDDCGVCNGNGSTCRSPSPPPTAQRPPVAPTPKPAPPVRAPTPSPVPQPAPVPQPVPAPSPKAAPVPSPTPVPQPASIPAPSPVAQPVPIPAPSPVAQPVPISAPPAAQPVPIPAPSPKAAPVPSPVPQPAPVSVAPIPSPVPIPTPSPKAAPIAAPVPKPAPVAVPTPTPTPRPSPVPAPVFVPAPVPKPSPNPVPIPAPEYSQPPIGGCDGHGGKPDPCGVCAGDGSTCKGCDDVPGSQKKFDLCGICGGNSSCIPPQPTVSGTLPVYVVWGVSSLDRARVDRNNPFSEFKGDVEYDESFGACLRPS
jgi:hypothetical protein